MNYKPGFNIFHKEKHPGYWFLFFNGELMVEERDGKTQVPYIINFNLINVELNEIICIGSIGEHKCFIVNLSSKPMLDGFIFKGLRQLFGELEDEWFWLGCRAVHILTWVQKNKFCGSCGGMMKAESEERALQCPDCQQTIYPRISPAIIVAVIKGERILLARSNRFPGAWYSVLAGFVEPGETLEECVKREVKEEVGIEIKDIRYFGSQPWPFPDSLMIGFTAKFAAGEIKVDNREIVAADWFAAHNLPDIPGKASIARKLIDWFIEKDHN